MYRQAYTRKKISYIGNWYEQFFKILGMQHTVLYIDENVTLGTYLVQQRTPRTSELKESKTDVEVLRVLKEERIEEGCYKK